MTSRLAGRTAALVVAACVGLVGCSSSSPTLTTGTTPPTRPTPTSPAGPHIVKAGASCRTHTGAGVTLRDPANHVVVTIATKKAKAYSGRLANYASAYPPEYGYFIKIPIKLTDIGPGTWRIDPTWFVLHTDGRRSP